MDNEDLLSLFINVKSENRLEHLIQSLEDIINYSDNKIDYIIKLNGEIYNLYDYLVKVCLYYYGCCDRVNNLFTLFSSKRRYKHNITNWGLEFFTNTIYGQLQGLPIMTSNLQKIYYFRNGHSNYFEGYKNDSRIAIKTVNNIYFLDENNENDIIKNDQLSITYIINIFEIEEKTNIPLTILQNIYSFCYKYKLIII